MDRDGFAPAFGRADANPHCRGHQRTLSLAGLPRRVDHVRLIEPPPCRRARHDTQRALPGLWPGERIHARPVGARPTGPHGFVRTPRSFAAVDIPGVRGGTFATGINDGIQLVRCFGDSRGAHGFVDTGGGFATIGVPFAYGINDTRAIVGNYVNVWAPPLSCWQGAT